ncbi:glycosyltransferase [Nocardioides sp. Y6]|uniref:Glycosyltransferase n=1 Tax=Nocardioides malaquae TaxID=2773426 RepID=A0ABR9RPQ0_9ACTN|nr:glycosyltransferase [Nocardioides malaquae]MBE7323375.1 glycosyltransferase [Nocardioides malaquae]
MARDAADLLLSSPLFDAEWYALRTGAEGDRAALVRHYLDTPLESRVSPHPLFDPEWFREQSPLDLRGKDPFLVYLRRRLFGTPTHPAFSTVHYRRTVPGAKEHPHGPIGHYVEVGAAEGVPGHRFLPVDAEGRGPDLRAWHLDRHRELLRLRSARPDDAVTPRAPAARSADVVSVVVPVPPGSGTWRDAWETVTPLVEAGAAERELQVLVVDGGVAADDAVRLDVLGLRHPEVEVWHGPVDGSGSTPAEALSRWAPQILARARGTVSVLLDHGVSVRGAWVTPLVEALGAQDVRAVQPVVLGRDGTVLSAGRVRPRGQAAYSFLAGLPLEDARGVERHDFSGLEACVALRTDDVAELLRSGAPDVTPTTAGGRWMVTPDSVVVRRRGGAGLALEGGRTVSGPEEAELWAAHGFDAVAPPSRLRRLRLEVDEPSPRLRWAIKNPAPAGAVGERWGDTHFASSLAAALRRVGQEVVVDRREAFDRPTAEHDDVDLLLRGLQPLRPVPDRVTLAWVISHPEALDEAEARAYDRVLAASVTWAEEHTRRWGTPVEPLLQATDPGLFHPDSALPDTGERVLFVGSARGEYRPMVRDAVTHGVPLALYGTGWAERVPPGVLRGEYVANTELSAAYRSAGVVLNDHWEDMRREGFLSNRLFDAVASGARVLTDDVAGLRDLFGRSVQVVRTPDDLVRLSTLADPDEVFGDDAERRRVAERVRREHSFDARARRLVEVAVEARLRRIGA